MKKTNIFIVLVAFMVTACNSGKIPRDAKIVEPIEAKTMTSSKFTLADFSLKIPDGWEEVPAANNMRVTQFQIKAHPEYDVIISYFGNNDNMVDANISRWRGQFTKEDSYENLSLTSDGPTGIKILGTYKIKPFPMAQQFTESPDYGMLAAILPSKDGPYFIKVTAPKTVINEEEPTFTQLLNSYSKIKAIQR